MSAGALAAGSNQQAADEAVVARFHQWCAGFAATPAAEAKALLLPEGLALAKERREAFKRLIRENPARALKLSETAAVRRSVPAEVAGLLEEQISGVGEIVVRRDGTATAGVSADGLAREARVNGRVFAAQVYGWRLVDQDFAGVPIRGVAVDGVLAVAESPLRVLDPEEVPAKQRQAGGIAADVGGQLRFFSTQAEMARAELELMYGRGLPMPGPEQQMAQAHEKKIRHVHPNALAWQRINERRRQKGLPLLSRKEMNVVPTGQELELEEGPATADAGRSPMLTAGYVDNSELQCFPPIRSQGALGSCAAFASTYYQMTHMTALVRGWDAKNGGDAFRFSPKWTYNLVNGGSDSGSEFYQCLDLEGDHGCVTWAEFPYDSDCLAWCMNSNAWRAAIGCRMNNYYTIGSLYTSNGLANLKAILDDGYVVTFETYAPWPYQGWVQGTVAYDPASPTNDFVGEQICKYVRGLDWGHGLNVVGYNDDIWCDLNGNGIVDPGEKGALKIANSWGSWANGGYAWFAYDALNSTSAVPHWNPPGKVYGFGTGAAANCKVFVVTAKPSYTPPMLACFTINHRYRNQVTMIVGKDSGTPTNYPAMLWAGRGLINAGGQWAFDGSSTVCDGTFWLDMSDLSPDPAQQKRYFIAMTDSVNPGSGQVKSCTLVDTATGQQTTLTPLANPNSFNPSSGLANNSTAWAFIDHACGTLLMQLTVPTEVTEGDVVPMGQRCVSVSPAPTNDLIVTLTSSDTSEVTVQPTVTILAGQTNATFDLTILDDAVPDGDQNATITAAATNYNSPSTTIVVHDNETATLTVSVPPNATEGDGVLTNAGTVHVSAPLTANLVVHLTSSDKTEAVVPATVTIPSGQTSATFDITIVEDGEIDGPQTATITAHVPNWTDGSAAITVLDEDFSALDHFSWSIVPSPQLIGEPFAATITAQDASNRTAFHFSETVAISALAPSGELATNNLLGSPGDEFRALATGTMGYSFTPNLDILVTHVRHYFGSKVSIWTDAGTLVATQNVVSVPGTWVETPLATPVQLVAGTPYRVGIYLNNVYCYGNYELPNTFPNGTIDGSFSTTADAFPTDSDDAHWWLVDLQYTAQALAPVPNSPGVSGNFTNGIWPGNLVLLQAATQVRLLADDGQGHTGLSLPFDVLGTPKLSIERSSNAVVLSWPSAADGFLLEGTGPLPPQTNWMSIVPDPVIIGDRNRVTNDLSGAARFYRLRKP